MSLSGLDHGEFDTLSVGGTDIHASISSGGQSTYTQARRRASGSSSARAKSSSASGVASSTRTRAGSEQTNGTNGTGGGGGGSGQLTLHEATPYEEGATSTGAPVHEEYGGEEHDVGYDDVFSSCDSDEPAVS